jgi:hypothetical protein
LSFRFVFVVKDGHDPLRAERELLASLLMEEIANGSVQLAMAPENSLADLCINWARRSLCHALLIDVRPRELNPSETTIHRLQINGPRPAFGNADSEPIVAQGDEPLESWCNVLQEILQLWTD